MLRPPCLVLLMSIAVSCSISPNATTPTNTPVSTATPILTPSVSIIAATPTLTTTPTAMATSPGMGSTRIIVLQATVPAPFASSSPTIARVTPLPRTGWQTYINANLHLAVDYPPDWTVRVQDNGAIFTSPQGVTIQLMPLDPRAVMPNDEIVQPNTRCSNTINPNGISVRTCLSTIGSSLDAYLDFKPAGGAETAVAISATSRAAFDVFTAMIESARIAP